MKWSILCLLAGVVFFYYENNFIPQALDSGNHTLGDFFAAYVPLVFALAWIVYGGYRFFLADKATEE